MTKKNFNSNNQELEILHKPLYYLLLLLLLSYIINNRKIILVGSLIYFMYNFNCLIIVKPEFHSDFFFQI